MAAERQKRGYDLTEEERIAQNVAFLKGNFLERATSNNPVLTVGATIGVPGMLQGHTPIAVDTLTGMMFLLEESEVLGYKSYPAQEKDIVLFDYVYLTSDPRRQQWIILPSGYTVFPFRLRETSDADMKTLSAEAVNVLMQTRMLLFKPVFPAIKQALALAQDNPKILKSIIKLAGSIEPA